MRVEHSTAITLLRHGQTDWNAQSRFQGQADVPLNEVGLRQAKAAGEALSRVEFEAVYSSPLSRALDTAQIVTKSQIVTDPRLMEINVGTWSGRTWAEVIAEFPQHEQWYANGVDFRRSETGETLAEVASRGAECANEIARRHEGGRVLIVAHGLLINRLLHSMLGLEGRVLGGLGNAHFSEIAYSHGAWRLLAHNVAP